MADGAQRSLAELGRTADRIERRQDELERRLDGYVTEKLFEARVGPLEHDKASRRNALLAVAGTVAGIVFSAVLTYLIARGGH